MPQRAKRLQREHPALNQRYIVFSHNLREAWVSPARTFADGCRIAREMLGAGAHLSLVIDSENRRIVHDATRPQVDFPTAAPWLNTKTPSN
jgi:hypothetical protein